MNYDELTENIYTYLENRSDEIVAAIDQIILQGEARIYSMVRTPDQRFKASSSVAGQTLNTPNNFIEPLGLYITGVDDPLLIKSTSFIRAAYGSSTGVPKYYAIEKGNVVNGIVGGIEPYVYDTIILGPTPDTTYNYLIEYIGIPTSITSPETTPSYRPRSTWLSVSFPDSLLYACLLEGYVYMKGDKDLLTTFQMRFDAAAAELRRSCEGLQLQDEYRNPPVGKEVTI